MKIRYENDSVKGPGFGVLHCSEEMFSAGDYVFSIQRATDHCFLGESDWSSQRVYLKPAAQHIEQNELLLFIGKQVVDALDTQENYRVSIQAPSGAPLNGRLQVSDVAYSASGTSFGMRAPAASAASAVSAVEADPAEAVVLPESPVEELPVETLAMDSQEKADPPVVEKKRSPVLLIVGILLLAALLGFAAWKFLGPKEPMTPVSQTAPEAPEKKTPESEKATPEKPAAAPEAPATPATTPPTTPATAAPQTPEQRVTLFFGGKDRTPEQAAALSRELPVATKADQDAVYRLYYFASENGELSVIMNYAACLDPSKPQWGNINKDAQAAWELYARAKATQPEAAAAQQNLKTWLEREAAGGSAQAKLWLNALK